MAFELPALPYAQDALAPHISAETMEYHYGKHHQTYVDNLNKAVAGTAEENASLEEIIMKAEGPLFNNAAQVWNHTFFWNSLSPNGGASPRVRRPSASPPTSEGTTSSAPNSPMPDSRSSGRVGPGSSRRTASSPS